MNHFKFNGHYNLPDWDSSVDKDWSSSKNNFTQSIAFGLDFDGSNRLAFDFTNFGKAYSEKWNEPNGINTNYNPNLNDHDYGKTSLRAYGLGVTYSYAFLPESIIRPYVGVRLGVGFIKTEMDTTDAFGYEHWKIKKTKFTIGATAGAEYKVTDHISAGVGIEYNRFLGTSPFTLQNFGGKVFARYTF